jgi:hypothetical protein
VVADAAERASLLVAADLIVLPADSCAGAVPEGWAAETSVLAPARERSQALDGALRLFPAGDPLALAREMDRLLRAPAGQRDAARGWEPAAAGWSFVAGKMEEVYRALVSARRR